MIMRSSDRYTFVWKYKCLFERWFSLCGGGAMGIYIEGFCVLLVLSRRLSGS